jgi:S-adenosylmethionine:tRNA ribosyltransferase-isomerase
VITKPVIEFELPSELEAHEPPELRGLRRDQVRLLVLPRRADKHPVHTRFAEIGKHLSPGDLLVVNNSRTLPALLEAKDETGAPVEVRLAQRRASDMWDALILNGRTHIGRIGMRLDFGQNLKAQVTAPNPDLPFLWQVQFDICCAELLNLIYRIGVPIRYSYIAGALPLDLYQTVYAAAPGSVEMVSAGRPFSWELLLELQRQGVGLATISLHTGISSTRDDAIDATQPNYEEEYDLPEATVRAIHTCHAQGGRVIAVGTTVVRTLESVAVQNDQLVPAHGWTRLHIAAGHQLRVVDGLLTGLHEPHSSHLDLLSAFVEPARLKAVYLQAIKEGYLWHEFGDMNLII